MQYIWVYDRLLQLLFAILLITSSLEGISKEAIIAILEAESYDVDVSTLIERFNYLQNLDNCNQECIDEYNSIIEDANNLKNTTRSKMINNYIFIFGIYIPIIAFLSSLLIIYIYDYINKFNLDRFMRMEIEYNDKHN